MRQAHDLSVKPSIEVSRLTHLLDKGVEVACLPTIHVFDPFDFGPCHSHVTSVGIVHELAPARGLWADYHVLISESGHVEIRGLVLVDELAEEAFL
jgi:hypothetical protein